MQPQSETPQLRYAMATDKREALQREINSHPIHVDRGSFQKTDEERKELSKLKNEFKANGLYQWNVNNRPGNNKGK